MSFQQQSNSLTGVGWSMGRRLEAINVKTCKDLTKISKAVLTQEYGAKTGETLYNFSRGIDERPLKLEQVRNY
jgi:nucleotidyltransferase/DNA polymerase involved in DNA repair